ncbi:unnamed protein product [Vitrella brassicaformis CCMP3155]|uniref:J domain-containing protein n=2 Tax=Vitrella brassicaformis TaxID=1169539 RepID=A0A0G4GFQ6_VITBC|nr:unnamed protein product [Vitrella brassicaformis CCMP3155]|eukprot:CEM28358.1 unnamed protein product [Vitrella brassicaformis CCMP3155]
MQATANFFRRQFGVSEEHAREDFVRRQQDRWHISRRPCPDPLDCDFRVALGFLPGEKTTRGDVLRAAKKVTDWYHPDKHGSHDTFIHFNQAKEVLATPRLAKEYNEAVEEEKELQEEEGGQIDWRQFNRRFLKRAEKKNRVVKAAGTTPQPSTSHGVPRANSTASTASTPTSVEPESAQDIQMCHLCLDGSGSMGGERVQKGKKALKELQPRLDVTPTNVHLISSKGDSRLIYRHTDILTESNLAGAWTTGGGTYLWEYIYTATKDYKDLQHEIIIITDGEDNHSPAPFSGLDGFNELMNRMKGKIRISLLLIGNSLSTKSATVYRDLCLATGGVYHHQADSSQNFSLVMQNFIAPLLLTEAERDIVACEQKHEYESLVAQGQATAFEWYLPITNGPMDETGGAVARPAGPSAPTPTPRRVQQLNSQVTVTTL